MCGLWQRCTQLQMPSTQNVKRINDLKFITFTTMNRGGGREGTMQGGRELLLSEFYSNF